ncbi:MAG: isocitrate/isopropylmalate family dehydrogenase, partial [Candidatus Limnocylindrales bacterium]
MTAVGNGRAGDSRRSGSSPGSDRHYRLVAIPGDGIGPEVVAAGRRVLEAAGQRFGFALEWQERVVGGAAIDRFG